MKIYAHSTEAILRLKGAATLVGSQFSFLNFNYTVEDEDEMSSNPYPCLVNCEIEAVKLD